MDSSEEVKTSTALPDVRLWKKARKAREVFFENYHDLDKGTVPGHTNPGSPCSPNLLAAMTLNTQKMCCYLMLDASFHRKRSRYLDLAIHIVLDETQAEFEHLLQHPRLFPDGSAPLFLNVIETRLRAVLSRMQRRQAANRNLELRLQTSINDHRKGILPDYDEFRTTWQQFLHNQAPGSGIPRDQIPFRHGCTQMITAACSLMAANISEEHENFAYALEVARERPLPPRQKDVAGQLPHEGYRRSVRFGSHLATSTRPAPKEPSERGLISSLPSLTMKYPVLAMRETTNIPHNRIWRMALNNDRAYAQEEDV